MGDPQAFIDQITELQEKASKLSASDGNVSVILQSARLLLEFIKIKSDPKETSASLKSLQEQLVTAIDSNDSVARDDSLQNVTLELLNALKQTVNWLSKREGRESTVKKEVKLEPEGAEDLFEVSDIEGDEAMDEVNKPTDVKVEPKEEDDDDLCEVSDFEEDEPMSNRDAVGENVVSEERRESAKLTEGKLAPASPSSPVVDRVATAPAQAAPARIGIATCWDDGTPFSKGFDRFRWQLAMQLDNENRKKGCPHSMHSFFDRADRACLMYKLILEETSMQKLSFNQIIDESRRRKWVQMDLKSWTESWEGPFRLAQVAPEVRSAIVDRLQEDKYARLCQISVKTIELLENHHKTGNLETIRRVIDLIIEKSHELKEAWGADMIEQEVQKIGIPLSQDPRTVRKRKAKAAAKERKKNLEESMKNKDKDEKIEKKNDDPEKAGEDIEE